MTWMIQVGRKGKPNPWATAQPSTSTSSKKSRRGRPSASIPFESISSPDLDVEKQKRKSGMPAGIRIRISDAFSNAKTIEIPAEVQLDAGVFIRLRENPAKAPEEAVDEDASL